MAPDNRREYWPRTASLIALGAFVVHQLRYFAASGTDAGSRLAAEGHGYFSGFVPLLAAFVLAVIASLVIRAASGRAPLGAPGTGGRRWAAFAVAIFLVFAVQESLEGLFAAGHASGLAAVFGHGAAWALPFSALVGLALAAFERRLFGFEARVAAAARRTRVARRRAPRSILVSSRLAFVSSPSPLAFGLARRPPPLAA